MILFVPLFIVTDSVKKEIINSGIRPDKAVKWRNACSRCNKHIFPGEHIKLFKAKRSEWPVNLKLLPCFALLKLQRNFSVRNLPYKDFEELIIFSAIDRIFALIHFSFRADNNMLPGFKMHITPFHPQNKCALSQFPYLQYFMQAR